MHRAFAAVLAVVLARQASAGDEPGMVMDASAGSPLGGAIAAVWWTGYPEKGDRSGMIECIGIRVANVDANGRFRLPVTPPKTAEKFRDIERHVLAFKAGYMDSPLGRVPAEGEETKIGLRPDVRPVRERMQYLLAMLARVECRKQPNRKAELLPYYRAVYREVDALRPMAADDRILREIHRRLVFAWVDGDQARLPADTERYFDDNVKAVLLSDEQ